MKKTFSQVCWLGAGLMLTLWSDRAQGAAVVGTTSVHNIADLRTTLVNPATYGAVNVLDYYNPPPVEFARGRGGGLFRWVTNSISPHNTVDDGGRFIVNTNYTSGLWERVLNGEVANVKMWGAKGDGSTDDTVAIQAALKSVRYFGNHLLVPAGTYVITNTLEFNGNMHLQGEGPVNTTFIKMHNSITNKDILRSMDATIALQGSLILQGNGQLTNSSGTVDFTHGLIMENLNLQFGDGPWTSTTMTGAGICISQPGEASVIRNVWVTGGKFGIRSLGPGTPGLKVENSTFFYNSTAGICVEGMKLTWQGVQTYGALGGPMTFTGISGDLMSTNQGPGASLILFSNCWPTATITDPSVEGYYQNGVIRCVVPPDAGGVSFGYLKVNGGTANVVSSDWVVVTNPNSSTTFRTPIVTIEPGNLYGLDYLIRDEFAGRNIKVPPPGSNQNPLRRPVTYESSGYWGTEKNSRLIYGDTIYQSFKPTTNGWWRIVRPYTALGSGGRIAINSYHESTEFEFNAEPSSVEINVLRKSKNAVLSPVITKARVLAFWEADIGGDPIADGYRCAVEVYVDHVPNNGSWYVDEVYITMPVDSRGLYFGDKVDLITPYFTGDTSSSSSNPGLSDESSYVSTGAVTLLR